MSCVTCEEVPSSPLSFSSMGVSCGFCLGEHGLHRLLGQRMIAGPGRSMPPLLVKAHQALDRVVDSAYMDAKEAAGRKPPKQCSDAKAYDLSVRALPATRLLAACCQAETRRAQESVEVDGVERRSVAWMRRLGTLGKESDSKFS